MPKGKGTYGSQVGRPPKDGRQRSVKEYAGGGNTGYAQIGVYKEGGKVKKNDDSWPYESKEDMDYQIAEEKKKKLTPKFDKEKWPKSMRKGRSRHEGHSKVSNMGQTKDYGGHKEDYDQHLDEKLGLKQDYIKDPEGKYLGPLVPKGADEVTQPDIGRNVPDWALKEDRKREGELKYPRDAHKKKKKKKSKKK